MLAALGTSLWRCFIRPLLFRLDPERTHYLAMKCYSSSLLLPGAAKLLSWVNKPTNPKLAVERFGIKFRAPVGLAAGFDKDGRWCDELANLGFGFIEIGTVTPLAQPGNERPRLFRLPRDRALINRMGFNNLGASAMAKILANTRQRAVLGINVGRAKASDNDQAASDYLSSIDQLFQFADYITINVSSPNTEGLRELQQRRYLELLLQRVAEKNRSLAVASGQEEKPVLLKIAPDLTANQLDEIAELVAGSATAGIIATNTTTSRTELSSDPRLVSDCGMGGLSGRPLTHRSRAIVAYLYRKTRGRVPIIGVGGIMSGADAWEMFRAGACLIQVYTGFIYGGPFFVNALNRYLGNQLDQRGLKSLDGIVGEAADQHVEAFSGT